VTDISLNIVQDVAASLGGIVSIIAGSLLYLKKTGTLDILLTKLTAVSYEEAQAIKDSNNALTKLNMSDEFVEHMQKITPGGDDSINEEFIIKFMCYLQKIAPGEDGTINEELATQIIKNQIIRKNHPVILPETKKE
jgi:hypothetical protein